MAKPARNQGCNWAFVVADAGGIAVDNMWQAHNDRISYIVGVTAFEDGRVLTKGWIQFKLRTTEPVVQRITRRGFVTQCRPAWGADEIIGRQTVERGTIRVTGGGNNIHQLKRHPSGRRTVALARHLPAWEDVVTAGYANWLKIGLARRRKQSTRQVEKTSSNSSNEKA